MAKVKVDSPFVKLVKFLRANGYKVVCHRRSATQQYRFATVKGKGIYAGFCEENGGNSYRYIDGRIAADNARCFNKWSQCPLVMKLPIEGERATKLLEHLAWLGSDAGHDWSNRFGHYTDKDKMPNEVEQHA